MKVLSSPLERTNRGRIFLPLFFSFLCFLILPSLSFADTIFYDNFTRSNSSSVGNNWLEVNEDWQIKSEILSYEFAIPNPDLGIITNNLNRSIGHNGENINITFIWKDTTNSRGGYFCYNRDNASNNVKLGTCILFDDQSNTLCMLNNTLIIKCKSESISLGSWYKVRIWQTGNSLKMVNWLNGTAFPGTWDLSITNFTDNFNGTNIAFSTTEGASTTSNFYFDNLLIENTTVPPAPKVYFEYPSNLTNTSNSTIHLNWYSNSTVGLDRYELYLDELLIDNITVGLVNGTYNYTNGSINEGKHYFNLKVYDILNKSNHTGINLTIDRSPPENITLYLPYDTDHTNINNTSFNWSYGEDKYTIVNYYELQIYNNSGLIYYKYQSTPNLTLPIYLNDGNYTWLVKYFDIVNNSNLSNNYSLVIDTVFPNWVLNNYPKFDNSTTISNSLNFDCSVSDSNLYRVNISLYNATYFFNYSFFDDLNGTTVFNCSGLNYNTTLLNNGNYTIELSATDMHTYGSLFNLSYSKNNNGITFNRNGEKIIRFYTGYSVNGNSFNLVSDEDIITSNISFDILKTGKGEYKFNMSFINPGTAVYFGFAFEKTNMKLINSNIGHFIVNDTWYLDFEDMVKSNFTIGIKETQNYYIIYSNTNQCNVGIGEICVFDPVIGGLNTRTEYYNIVKYTPPTPPTPLFNDISLIIQGLVSIMNVFYGLILMVSVIILSLVFIESVRKYIKNILERI